MITLADEAAFWMEAVNKGGPFAAALVMLVVAVLVIYKAAGKPTIDGFIQISVNLRDASADAMSAARESKEAARLNVAHGEMLKDLNEKMLQRLD